MPFPTFPVSARNPTNFSKPHEQPVDLSLLNASWRSPDHGITCTRPIIVAQCSISPNQCWATFTMPTTLVCAHAHRHRREALLAMQADCSIAGWVWW